eukprot:g13251.t1
MSFAASPFDGQAAAGGQVYQQEPIAGASATQFAPSPFDEEEQRQLYRHEQQQQQQQIDAHYYQQNQHYLQQQQQVQFQQQQLQQFESQQLQQQQSAHAARPPFYGSLQPQQLQAAAAGAGESRRGACSLQAPGLTFPLLNSAREHYQQQVVQQAQQQQFNSYNSPSCTSQHGLRSTSGRINPTVRLSPPQQVVSLSSPGLQNGYYGDEDGDLQEEMVVQLQQTPELDEGQHGSAPPAGEQSDAEQVQTTHQSQIQQQQQPFQVGHFSTSLPQLGQPQLKARVLNLQGVPLLGGAAVAQPAAATSRDNVTDNSYSSGGGGPMPPVFAGGAGGGSMMQFPKMQFPQLNTAGLGKIGSAAGATSSGSATAFQPAGGMGMQLQPQLQQPQLQQQPLAPPPALGGTMGTATLMGAANKHRAMVPPIGAHQHQTTVGKQKLIARVIISDDFEPDLQLRDPSAGDSTVDEEGPEVPICELRCEESSVDVYAGTRWTTKNPLTVTTWSPHSVELLNAITHEPVQTKISLPVRFLNLHLNNVSYRNGACKQVEEKALIKCPLGKFGGIDSVPALRIQLCGSSGKVGFVDRGREEDLNLAGGGGGNYRGSGGAFGGMQAHQRPKRGEGIFQYALHFEADAVAEGTPESDDRELFLDIKCMLTGVINVSKLEESPEDSF